MKKNVYGEGNYEATRDYNSRTKKFIDSGRVDAAAKAAAPASPAEAQDMQRAEEAALLRARGDDAGSAPDVDPAALASTGQSSGKKQTAAPLQKRQ